VLVPFGPRTLVGLVLAQHDTTDREDVRDLEAVLENAPPLPDDALPLARWMADYYLCELGDALRPFLPHGAGYRIGRTLRLSGEEIPDRLREDRDAAVVLRALAVKETNLLALRRLLSPAALSRAVRLLKAHRIVTERAFVLPPEAKTKKVRRVEFAAGPLEVHAYCEEHARRAKARVACLRTFQQSGPLPTAELAKRAGVSVSVVQALVKQGLLKYGWTTLRRVPWRGGPVTPSVPPTLSPEQAAAVAALLAAVRARRADSFLLYGVTASGKTEVFLHAIAETLRLGRQAIVLMPEISLTAQAIGLYRARFGDRVAILHSALSVGERWDESARISSGEAAVIIGARSALFAPTRALGLIVIDEEHETSYKQEQAPRYHARDVALKRGEMNSCPVLLASATPAVESFYLAESGRHRLLRLPTRVEDRPLPTVQIVDLRGAARQPAIFSNPLRQGLARRLQSGEQTILFLNRRGYATFLLCPTCGHSLRCADCGVALTFYQQDNRLRCHHCGISARPPDLCANCGGRQLRFSGFGTERVESELARLFPQARPGRMDRDTTAGKGAHLRIISSFRAADTDVLIGTQMVAKGFDFPGVTLVGVISADTALNLPDFRAGERTFQLLTQVAGRSGRGEKEGEVVIQTYQPDHYAVLAAAEQDYEAFYRQELEMRRELRYPPFSQLAGLVFSSESNLEAERRAALLAEQIRAADPTGQVEVLGPAPAPLARLRGRYRWRLLLRAPHGLLQPTLRTALTPAPDWPQGNLVVDVDPVSLM
jgi:primosomal protein N' (replication factor Y)